jgi:hypothetical protein
MSNLFSIKNPRMNFVENNLLLHMKQQYAKVFIFLPLVGEYEPEGLCGTV